MIRVHLRVFLLVIVGFSFIISLSYVNRCPPSSTSGGNLPSGSSSKESLPCASLADDDRVDKSCPNASTSADAKCACSMETIDVDVNEGEALVSGRKEGSEVFVPFNFVRKYFDIYGKFEDDGETRFLWSHR